MSPQSQNRLQKHLSGEGGHESSLTERCCDWTEDCIRENPLLSTMITFGAGLGVGIICARLLAEPLGVSRRNTAETLGRRVLDSLSEVLPESVRAHLNV